MLSNFAFFFLCAAGLFFNNFELRELDVVGVVGVKGKGAVEVFKGMFRLL